MIIALLFLPLLLVVFTVGLPAVIFLVVIPFASIQYTITYAFVDCVKSWNIFGTDLDEEEEGLKPSRKARRRSRSFSPPPDLETISEEQGNINADLSLDAPQKMASTGRYPNPTPTHLRAECALSPRRRVRFASPRESFC